MDTVTRELGLLVLDPLAHPVPVKTPELEVVLEGKGVAVPDTPALPLGVGWEEGVKVAEAEGEEEPFMGDTL